jgi:hypothetical protein
MQGTTQTCRFPLAPIQSFNLEYLSLKYISKAAIIAVSRNKGGTG